MQAEGRDLVPSSSMCCGADRSSVSPVPSASPVNSAPPLKWDITNFVGRQLSSTDERAAVVDVFTPDADFLHPARFLGSKRGLSILAGFLSSMDLSMALLKTQPTVSPVC